MDGAHQDCAGMQIAKTRVTLHKYDGEPPVDGENKQPVETLVIEDGQLVEHTIRKP